ncbi:ABC transporter ATP-binding protein [Archaeoglobus sp.]
MLTINNLTVKYGDKIAVDSISFTVREGEVFGLLGPNGAGKTSTLKAIVSLVPYQGEIRLFDKPIDVKAKNLIGYVPEEFMLLESLTPKEFFEFIASVRRIENVNERLEKLVRAFGIEQYLDTPITALSMGTKQKVTIVSALLHNPPLLILDEPLNGLDAKSSKILKEIMAKHVEKGGAIVFSTHIMEIAEKLCDRIAVINNGKIIAKGSIEELREIALTDGSLEDIFLRLTGQMEEIESILRVL